MSIPVAKAVGRVDRAHDEHKTAQRYPGFESPGFGVKALAG